MPLPYFFSDKALKDSPPFKEQSLDEETSRHIVQVLRMQSGENILLTDGLGSSATAEIINANKKSCTVKLLEKNFTPRLSSPLTIAISLIKNTSRFEWFLEKATEFGVAEIIPLLCKRTEKQKFRHDRMQTICKSAMLQSMQTWLPILSEPQAFPSVIHSSTHQLKCIAHCLEDTQKNLLKNFSESNSSSQIILIGPEGDFSPEEIKTAIDHKFFPVSLGTTRLRTETAGLYAAAVFNR